MPETPRLPKTADRATLVKYVVSDLEWRLGIVMGYGYTDAEARAIISDAHQIFSIGVPVGAVGGIVCPGCHQAVDQPAMHFCPAVAAEKDAARDAERAARLAAQLAHGSGNGGNGDPSKP